MICDYCRKQLEKGRRKYCSYKCQRKISDKKYEKSKKGEERRRRYLKKPETKARRKEYYQIPRVKDRHRIWMREHMRKKLNIKPENYKI